MNTFERTQEISNISPHSLYRVAVDLADAIAVIIPGPLVGALTYRGVITNDMIVALVFVGVDCRTSLGEAMDVISQCLAFRIFDDAQAHFACLASDGADNWWTIILVGASTSPFVGPPSRWVPPIEVFVTFFPPRSETSRLSQSVCPSAVSLAGVSGHSRVLPVSTPTQWCNAIRAPQPMCSTARLSESRAITVRLSAAAPAAFQTPSQCTDCTFGDNVCSGTSSTGFLWSCETRMLLPLEHHNEDISALPGENAPVSIAHSLLCLGDLVLEIPCLQVYHKFTHLQ